MVLVAFALMDTSVLFCGVRGPCELPIWIAIRYAVHEYGVRMKSSSMLLCLEDDIRCNKVWSCHCVHSGCTSHTERRIP